ncbi:MAG: CDP-alcohol phosphatidyltransferase family protein [Gammaproteobacteria bacterium]
MGSIFRLSQIPNAICLLRIALIIPIVMALIAGHSRLALLLMFLAGLSDGLDGYLAKRFQWRSRVGGILDPLADKLLLVSVFIALAWVGLAPVWLAAIVIFRDIVIIAGAIAYQVLIGPVDPAPTRISKLNTALQLIFIVFIICYASFAWPPRISIIVIGAGVLFASLVSGLDYVLCWSSRALAAGRK